jgi:poly(ADP-ribose) glycohydrolase
MDFQTGQIIPSATQEEILFSIRPEMFIAMFICQRIHENEIIIISGANRLFEYEGYSNSFKFKRILENFDNLNENVLALDATMFDHYLFNNLIQDISKFYTACNYCNKKYSNPGISTGSWGCGAFGCDKAHKFLQQLICAKVNNVKLSFSTFGNENYYYSLKKLFNSVIEYTPKVSDLWELIINFKGNSDEEFHKYLKQQLGNEFYI